MDEKYANSEDPTAGEDAFLWKDKNALQKAGRKNPNKNNVTTENKNAH